MPHRLVTYLEDAAAILATFVVLEWLALTYGFAWALGLIFAGCVLGMMALRVLRD